MADFVIAAADVLDGLGTPYVAGEIIDAGEVCFIDTADNNKVKLAANDTAAKATVKGIALNSALAADQPVNLHLSGSLTVTAAVFAAVEEGAPLFLSNTAGKIIPMADLSGSEYVTYLGWVTDSNKLFVSIRITSLLYAVPA